MIEKLKEEMKLRGFTVQTLLCNSLTRARN